ncbi:MAG: AI-2E family transporter [Planctomycetota bacterium]
MTRPDDRPEDQDSGPKPAEGELPVQDRTDGEAPDPTTFPPPWNYLIPLGTRLLIWGLFLGILYLLRDFLPVLFLTFVFAYIAEHGVEGLQHRIRSRMARAIVVFALILGVLGMVGTFLGPELKQQADRFVREIPQKLGEIDKFLVEKRKEHAWLRDFIDEDPNIRTFVLQELGLAGAGTKPAPGGTPPPHAGGTGGAADPAQGADQHGAWRVVIWVFQAAFKVSSIFLLSILFAFLIVKDLPRIAAGVSSLQHTKLKIFYDEVANSVFRFGQVLGRFIEAQAVIALVNTLLTALGMLILGIPNIAFLSAVVFLCSFIPVVGVFISTVPICVEALVGSGFGSVVAVVGMVTAVHMLEAYVFNPLIMGHHLRLNPVLVLIVLFISHSLFGVWGLLLGVPAVTYVLSYAIKIEPRRLRLRRGPASPGRSG